MKQMPKKRIIVLVALLIFLISPTVLAKPFWGEDFNGDWDQDTGKNSGEGIATGGKCTTIKGRDKYQPSVTTDFENKKITIKVSDGKFKVFVFVNTTGTDLNPTLTYNISAGQSSTFSYDPYDDEQDVKIAIVYMLEEADNLCGVYRAGTAYSDDKSDVQLKLANGENGGYVYIKRVEVGRDVSNATVENTNYDGICAAFRNGNYSANANLAKKVNKDDFAKYNPTVVGQEYYQDKLPYCYSRRVKADFREIDVASMINFAIKGYKTSTTTGTSGSIGTVTPDAIRIDGNADTDAEHKLTRLSLTCPAYTKLANGNYAANTSETQNIYYIEGETNKSSTLLSGKKITCDRKCRETITITYGPPVAIRAGLCFEYRVKVKSEVKCETKVVGEEPKLSDYDVCTPIPACVHDSGWVGTAAGPNDEFTKCVNECDGGKYTQSCINSCYNKVYENTTTTNTSVNKTATIENVAKKSTFNYSQECTKNKPEKGTQAYYNCILANKNSSIKDVQEALKNGRNGKYVINSNNTISWNAGSYRLFWDQLGRYYTDFSSNYLSAAQGGGWVFSDSFARANYGTSVCGAVCSWTGCPLARANGYYHGGKATNGQFINKEDVVAGYEVDMETYQNVMKECKAAASCSTNTATFTITVNNKLTSSNGDNYINYDKASLTPGNGLATKTDSDSIILENDFCYNSDKEISDSQKYLTEWSFPGTWINNKTGEISYDKKTDSAWHEKKDKFCTNLKSAMVNTEWWQQKVEGTELTSDKLVKDIVYNIKASTEKFGYYSWNVNLQCFYSIYDKTKDSNTNPGSNADDNDLLYRLRSVELEDVFPSTEGKETSESTSTGRVPGFNWTNAATNLKNDTYRVTPGALTSAIQTRGNTIYSNKDEYLDYEFELDRKTLNEIKDDSKNKKFNSYGTGSNYKVVNGVSVYTSELISKYAKTRGNVGCNNDGTGTTCEKIDNEYTEVVGGGK